MKLLKCFKLLSKFNIEYFQLYLNFFIIRKEDVKFRDGFTQDNVIICGYQVENKNIRVFRYRYFLEKNKTEYKLYLNNYLFPNSKFAYDIFNFLEYLDANK